MRHESFRLGFSVAERIDNMIEQARQRGLRVRQLKLSMREYHELYWRAAHGCYRHIPLRLVGRDVWT